MKKSKLYLSLLTLLAFVATLFVFAACAGNGGSTPVYRGMTVSNVTNQTASAQAASQSFYLSSLSVAAPCKNDNGNHYGHYKDKEDNDSSFDENIEEEIGKNYAMLCERVGDEWFSDLGSKVYVETDMYVCGLIEKYEFEE